MFKCRTIVGPSKSHASGDFVVNVLAGVHSCCRVVFKKSWAAVICLLSNHQGTTSALAAQGTSCRGGATVPKASLPVFGRGSQRKPDMCSRKQNCTFLSRRLANSATHRTPFIFASSFLPRPFLLSPPPPSPLFGVVVPTDAVGESWEATFPTLAFRTVRAIPPFMTSWAANVSLFCVQTSALCRVAANSQAGCPQRERRPPPPCAPPHPLSPSPHCRIACTHTLRPLVQPQPSYTTR